MSIALSEIELDRRLGDGGQGEVFLVKNRPGQAFKRYRDTSLPFLRPDVLEELSRETGQLRLEGRPITHWATWPTETVRNESGSIIGFLMPLLDSVFVMTEGNLKGEDSKFSYLASNPAPYWGSITLPSQSERANLLALLAGVMQQLHHRNMVVGDLSWNNVLWAQLPEPRVILLDCDGIRPPNGVPVSPQLDTPDWNDPHALPGSAPDADRDCYKLSLMVLRVLSRDLTARPSPAGGHNLGDLAAPITDAIDELLVRSGGLPGSRPTATEWRQTLQGRAARAVSPPAHVDKTEIHWPDGTPRPARAFTARRFRQVSPSGADTESPVGNELRPTPYQAGGRHWVPVDPGRQPQ